MNSTRTFLETEKRRERIESFRTAPKCVQEVGIAALVIMDHAALDQFVDDWIGDNTHEFVAHF